MDVKLSDLPKVIYSCFVLQNFCEMEKEPVSDIFVTCDKNGQQQLLKTSTKKNKQTRIRH